MKKIIISKLALSFIWLSFTIVASDGSFNFESPRARFERLMYARSGGMLSKEKYEELIKPFLDKAEKELKSVQFCEQQKQKDCAECQNYFDDLLRYNVACFQDYAQNNGRTNRILKSQKSRLEYSIRDLTKQGALRQNEVEVELQKTEQLFLDGNIAFYDALPWRIKAFLWATK